MKKRILQLCGGQWEYIPLTIILCSIIVLPGKSLAEEKLHLNITIVTQPALGAFVANAVPQMPMMEDTNEVKIAGGIYQFNLKENNANESTSCTATACNHQVRSDDGKGISVSFTHSYGPHLGAQIITAYAQSHGNIGARTGQGTSGTTDSRKYSGPIEEKGYLVGAGIILDPFSDPDGFRFPVTLGLSYADISVDWDVPFIFTNSDYYMDSAGQHGQDTGSISYSTFGGYGAIAPQWNMGPIRWSLVEFAAYSFGNKPDGTWTVKNLDTGATRESKGGISGSPDVIFGLLLSATYRPWGLTLTYAPYYPGDVVGKALTTYILSWSKKW